MSVDDAAAAATGPSTQHGIVLPPYPYDRLDPLKAIAEAHEGGIVDLSIGTPTDPAPESVVAALGAATGSERGYPPSIGIPELRDAVVAWFAREFGVTLERSNVAAAVGSKEFVVGLPHWMRLRRPDRDTVLYPELSYPSYEMGATLAGCRPVPVATDPDGRLDLSSISDSDARRALLLWSNSPSNPAGGVDDLSAAADWGRSWGVPVFSDECYIEFSWDRPPSTMLSAGVEGVVAVHSLSKRSNLAGARVAFYAGDPELVHYLSEIRKHAGFMVPGPCQEAGIAALEDQDHVVVQRDRYRRRLQRMIDVLAEIGVEAEMPDGGFYLFPEAPNGDAWGLTERLARDLGVLVSPGEFYGAAGSSRVRVAVVRPDAAYDLIESRLG